MIKTRRPRMPMPRINLPDPPALTDPRFIQVSGGLWHFIGCSVIFDRLSQSWRVWRPGTGSRRLVCEVPVGVGEEELVAALELTIETKNAPTRAFQIASITGSKTYEKSIP